jgi:hypothetical protein
MKAGKIKKPQNPIQSVAVQTRNGANQFLESEGSLRLTLAGFLRSLESNPRLLACVAKTPHSFSLAEATLRRWKEAGYPHPGDWPHSEYRPVVSFVLDWFKKTAVQSFIPVGFFPRRIPANQPR